MNLRCMTNTCYRPIFILLSLFIISACGKSDDGSNQSTGQPDKSAADTNITITAQDRDDRERLRCRRDCDDDDDDHHTPGGGDPGGGVNIIAVHNPSSSQYDDNCLVCHGDIPNSQSLNSAIPNAHVAMLPFTPGEDSDQCVWCHRDVSNTLIHTAAQVGAFQTDIRKTVDTQLCAICHGPVGPGKQFFQTGLTTSADPDGAELYYYLCSACHGELANSEVKGESAQEIYDAIAENEGGMGPLSVLNPTWVQAITVALGGDPTLPADIPAPGTGDALYQQYCSNCHGALANSEKTGATAGQIQGAIDSDTGGMGQLSFLTAQQVQDIANALGGGGTGGGGTGGGGTGGTDGAALYDQYCMTCHGSLSNSDQAGASAALIQNGINNVGEMSSLSFLTATQVQAISDALSGGTGGGGTGGGGTGGGGTGGTDGAALYDQYCMTCHGNLSNSDQAGASAALIQSGINNVGEMSSLSFLTSTQVQAISDALSGGGTGGGGTGGGGTGGTDGASLYNQYCAGCHGSLSDSEVRDESAGDIENAIEENEGGMENLDFLTSEQIDAIAEALD